MASRRRSSAAKAKPLPSTHQSTMDTLFLPAGQCAGHTPEARYTRISKVLSLYGIDGTDLEATFHSNTTAFAEAVVDRYYSRDRSKGWLDAQDTVDLVEIRNLRRQALQRHANACDEASSAIDTILNDVLEEDDTIGDVEVEAVSPRLAEEDASLPKSADELDLFSYDDGASAPAPDAHALLSHCSDDDGGGHDDYVQTCEAFAGGKGSWEPDSVKHEVDPDGIHTVSTGDPADQESETVGTTVEADAIGLFVGSDKAIVETADTIPLVIPDDAEHAHPQNDEVAIRTATEDNWNGQPCDSDFNAQSSESNVVPPQEDVNELNGPPEGLPPPQEVNVPAVVIRESCEIKPLERFHSLDSARDATAFHDLVSARSFDVELITAMIQDGEAFKLNAHLIPAMLCSLNVGDLDELKEAVDVFMVEEEDGGQSTTAQMIFVLVLFLRMSHKDPMRQTIFVRLMKKTNVAVASSPDDEFVMHLYPVLLEFVSPLISKELSFELSRSLIDSFVELAFRMRPNTNALSHHVNVILKVSANRCNTVDDYASVMHMVTSRVVEGGDFSRLHTTLLLRLFELMLSSVNMVNPFQEFKNLVHKLVEASLTSNFPFLKGFVDSLIKQQEEIVAHFVLLFIAKLMMRFYRDDKLAVSQKRKCIKMLQIISVPVFELLDEVEKSCGFIKQYVNCFKETPSSLFKLSVFDLSALDGCGKPNSVVSHPHFDQGVLKVASHRYMAHLDCRALHNGKICDLVLLMSLKHVALTRVIKKYGKRKILSETNSGMFLELHDAKRLKPGEADVGDVSFRLVDTNRSSLVPPLQLEGHDGEESPCSSVQTPSEASGDPVDSEMCIDNFDNSQRGDPGNTLLGYKHHGYADKHAQPEDERLIRYAKIVSRLFAATKGVRIEGTMQPEIAQYLLIPPDKLSHMEDYNEAETCYKVILYHIYSEIFLNTWRTMTNVLYSTNDYSQLNSASTFLYETVARRFDYLRYRGVRNLVAACLGDQCYMVRLAAVRLLSDLFKIPEKLDDCVNESLMEKLMLGMRDVNWKVRFAATGAIFHYIRRNGINMQTMPAVSSVAERICDIEKEQPTVRELVLCTLAFSLFSTSHPFMTQPGALEGQNLDLIERFVKVILYKMSAFKAQKNPIQIILQVFKEQFIDVEGKQDSSFLQALPKNDLKEVVENHSKQALEKWMSILLDLFLLKRSEGASFHVLAEVLCVLKLFGQVNPEIFASHMTYFIPYLNVDKDDIFDPSRIDVMVLVCNLVSISSGHSKDLQNIDHHVVQLVSFDAPALTRAAIQLLVELGSYGNVTAICDESFSYLSSLKAIIERERNSPHEIVKVISYNVLLKSAWKLGCIAEFVDLGQLHNDQLDWPQKFFDLLLSMSDIFFNAKLYNIAGMLVQSIARVFMNVKNIARMDFKGVKSLVKLFGEEAMVSCVMMLLYQLLSIYGNLSNQCDSATLGVPAEKIRFVRNEVFCCLGNFVETFVNLVSMGKNLSEVVTSHVDLDRVMALEICNMIFVNRLTNPESMVPFVFCHIMSQDANVQRLSEQALKTLAKNDPDIFLAKLASSIQALFLAVVLDSFAASVRASQQTSTPRASLSARRSWEHGKFSDGDKGSTGRANSPLMVNNQGSEMGTATSEGTPSRKPPNLRFILGYESQSTAARVRGILRLFLESIITTKHLKRLVTILMGQLETSIGRDFRENLSTVISKHELDGGQLEHIRPTTSGRLPRLLMKQISVARKGDNNGLVDYFTLLFVDMISTVLDHMVFRDAKVAKFLSKMVTDVMKKEQADAPDGLIKYRDSRLLSLSSKIKQCCM